MTSLKKEEKLCTHSTCKKNKINKKKKNNNNNNNNNNTTGTIDIVTVGKRRKKELATYILQNRKSPQGMLTQKIPLELSVLVET